MLKFLRERREAIESGLKKSEAAEQQFKEMRKLQAKELSKTRKEAQQIVDEAKKRAEEAKTKIISDTRKEQEALFSKAEKDIENLKNQRLDEAEREIGKLAIEGMEYLVREKISNERKTSLQEEAIAHIKSIKNAA